MKYINILTFYKYHLFDQQLDKDRYKDEFCFYENSVLDIEWDMVLVFEAIQFPISIKCKKGGLVFISGEPPMSSVYSSIFLKQFDLIVTSNPKLRHNNNILSQQCLNWHFGHNFETKEFNYTFDEIRHLNIPVKTKNISTITSSQAVLPGHLKRSDLLKKIQKIFGDQIDYFGRGHNPVIDKAEAILPYRFHICLENSFIDDYWTEKFADPLLGYSIPIYCGCTNMNKYFSSECYYSLDLNDTVGSLDLIKEILSNPEVYYNKKIEALKEARQLLLDKYNIYPTIVELYSKLESSLRISKNLCIKPNHSFFNYIFLNYLLRLKRFLYKRYYIIIHR